MSVRTPGELLDLPAERSARWLALRFLDEAEAAHARLDDASDAEALHDFRVALRRLRSTVRAYRDYLGDSVAKKDLRRLRDLARATGGARDAEVHIEWIEKRLDRFGGDERFGAAWLLEELRDRKADAEDELRREVRRDFGRERWRLSRRLRFYRVEVSLDDAVGGARMAAVLGRLVREAALEAQRHLERVRAIADQEQAHEARIAGKRLRYLLEPFADELEGGPEAIKRLKKLQDLLGDMHDADVLSAEAARALADLDRPAEEDDGKKRKKAKKGDAGDGGPSGRAPVDRDGADGDPDRPKTVADVGSNNLGPVDGDPADPDPDLVADAPDPRPGLHALTAMLEREREELFAALRERWLGKPAAEFFAQVRELAHRAATAGHPDREIERKYLLKRMPRLEAHAEVREIDQGWLPGERLAERLRRVRYPDGTQRYFRTVKLGSGTTRFELEEETTPDVFRKLWALTKGKRVRKLRYRVKDGDFVWEIDRFRGRRLVLAEVEIPTEDTRVEPPAWLRRFVVREVTGEPEYVNINLAQ